MITWGQPLWFWALLVVPLLVVLFVVNETRRARLVRQLVALRLEDRLAGSASAGKRRTRMGLLLLGLICIIISLAQPRLGYTWLEKKTRGLDVIIAVDTSRSMLANDLAPTRLLRAKLAAEDLVTQLAGNRIGLIAFAGSSFLQAPLTADQSAVLNSLRELDTEIIPRGGTNIADAIRTAADAFGKGESENRALVIFTDGEELDTDGQEAAEQYKDSFRVFTVGVGSKEGTVIALPDGVGGTDYLKDPQGQIVKSRLDEDRLRVIAEATGGFYLQLQAGLADMQRLFRDGLSTMNDTERDTRLSRQPIERYQWPLGAGMLLLALSSLIGERRRRGGTPAAAIAAALWLALSGQSVAAINPGVDAYQQEEYKKAREAFEQQLARQPNSPDLQYNLGSAAYKAGDYAKALEAFSKALPATDPALRSKAAYNLGNTLVQRGLAQKEKKAKIQELKNALQHYDTALNANAQNEDAEYNRDAVRKMIEELEKEEKQQEQKEQEKQDQQKQEQQDQQKQDQEQQGQGSDQKDPQQGQQDQKDQQKQSGDEQQDQESQGKGDQQKEQQGEQGEPKDQQEGDGEQQQQPQPKPGEGEDQQKMDQSDKGQEGEDPKEQEGQTPEPQPGEKPEGELKSNPAPGGEGTEQTNEEAQAAEEAAAAAEGRMTEAQAKSLLESLKGEDDKVRLLNPRDPRSSRVLRDW